MKICENGICRHMTAEEIAAFEKDMQKAVAIEANRPLTEAEVTRLLIAQQVNALSVDDHTALRMKDFYPQWEENTAYAVGYKVRYDGKLWRCLTAHTSISTWEPSAATASLWETVNETHEGTLEDPIPYDGAMALENGKYYIQYSEIYLCSRATGSPVYHALAALVGQYVEEI